VRGSYGVITCPCVILCDFFDGLAAKRQCDTGAPSVKKEVDADKSDSLMSLDSFTSFYGT